MRGEGLADVAELGLRGAEKLPPHRRVEEQVADFDRRARPGSRRARRSRGLAAGDLNLRAAVTLGACGCAAPAG